jgi:hypothetical protein
MNTKTYTGINIQWPISELILSGKKTIETRTYPIPSQYLNQEMLIIETPGKQGKFKARIVAIIKFSKCIQYKSKKEFYKDSNKHFVTPDSAWAWKEKSKYGWEINYIINLSESLPAPLKKGIVFTKDIKLHIK